MLETERKLCNASHVTELGKKVLVCVDLKVSYKEMLLAELNDKASHTE